MAPPTPERRAMLLRRMALWCALLLLAVGALSAYLRLDKLGLGCEHWPQCYGQSLRDAQRGVAPTAEAQIAAAAARLAHRVAASAALVLVIVLVMVAWSARPALRSQARLAGALLALALALSVLGLWSAQVRVPAVSMGNLIGGFVMLALAARLAWAPPGGQATRLRGWIAAGLALLLAQVALGGLVSASHAGLSCIGLDGCTLAEMAHADGWSGLNPLREPRIGDWPDVNPGGALAHSLHRYAAIAVAAALLPLAALAWRAGRRRTAAVLLALLAAQLATGAMMVAMGLPLSLALLHNLLAAASLAALVLLI